VAIVSVVLLGSACSEPSGHRAVDSPVESATSTRSKPPSCPGALEWCHLPRMRLPSSLRNRLALRRLYPNAHCPLTRGHRYSNNQFGGVVLGHGSIQPLVAPNSPQSVEMATEGVLEFDHNPSHHKWYSIKTLWFSRPSYRGPAVIRGRQLDGAHEIMFGERPSLIDPYLPPGATTNGTGGFREWPGATWIKAAGCYAWQIDTTDGSELVVFEAKF
jgi:hypothetical protein